MTTPAAPEWHERDWSRVCPSCDRDVCLAYLRPDGPSFGTRAERAADAELWRLDCDRATAERRVVRLAEEG